MGPPPFDWPPRGRCAIGRGILARTDGGVMASERVEGRNGRPVGVLDLNTRCKECGSAWVEWESWEYSNLPLNDSDGSGDGAYCPDCDVSGVSCTWDGPITAADWKRWAAHRKAEGMEPLGESDDLLLGEYRAQIDRLTRKAAACRVELARMEFSRG